MYILYFCPGLWIIQASTPYIIVRIIACIQNWLAADYNCLPASGRDMYMCACAWLVVCVDTISIQECTYYNRLPVALVLSYYINGYLCLVACACATTAATPTAEVDAMSWSWLIRISIRIFLYL